MTDLQATGMRTLSRPVGWGASGGAAGAGVAERETAPGAAGACGSCCAAGLLELREAAGTGGSTALPVLACCLPRAAACLRWPGSGCAWGRGEGDLLGAGELCAAAAEASACALMVEARSGRLPDRALGRLGGCACPDLCVGWNACAAGCMRSCSAMPSRAEPFCGTADSGTTPACPASAGSGPYISAMLSSSSSSSPRACCLPPGCGSAGPAGKAWLCGCPGPVRWSGSGRSLSLG